MADLSITIPSPQLTTGQYFKVRYRQLPSGSWSAYSNRSNAAFTISGLTEGDVEIEFKLVNADGSECAAVYRTYKVYGDYDCIGFDHELVPENKLVYLELTYTLPLGHTAPPCGWELEYTDPNGTVVIPYSTLPPSGKIRLKVPNVTGIIKMKALLCNGKSKVCYVDDVTPVYVPPPCIPMYNPSMTLVEERNNGKCEYFLVIKFTQSIPASTNPKLVYQQSDVIGMGDYFNGTLPISPTTTVIKRKLNPLIKPNAEYFKYNATFIDNCGSGIQIIDEVIWRNCY